MTVPNYESVEIVTPSIVRARHYGYILPNGAQCIIIEDPDAKMASAAMTIHAGQLNDPPDIPGLAHLCEHMLFMGTAKYPREDEYDRYVTTNGGHCNAWTSLSDTTFFFTVAMEALVGGLERFLEFFVAPSFNAGALSREIQAVHSEDEKNHHSDYWRVDEIDRSLVDPRHPRHLYSNGNAATLRDGPSAAGVDVRAALCRFFAQHYISSAACLAVYSALPPAAVLRAVEGPLLRMRSGPVGPLLSFLPCGAALLRPTAMGAWINVRTARKARAVRVAWAVAAPIAKWRSLPGRYAAHLLGHECGASVLGALRRANWATALVAGPMRVDDDHEIFSVEIVLTPDGMRHILDVIDTLYEGVGVAARVDPTAYAQSSAEDRLSFESSEVGAAAEHCAALTTNAHAADLRHCWAAGAIVIDDNNNNNNNNNNNSAVEEEEAYAAQLTPERAFVTLKWGEMPCAVKKQNKESKDTEEGSTEEGSTEEGEVEEEDDAAALFQCLPDFARVPCDRTTQFHRAHYSLSAVPPAVIARWAMCRAGRSNERRGVALPPENPFLATDFSQFSHNNNNNNNNNNDNHNDSNGAVLEGIGELLRTSYGVARVRPDAGRHRSFKTAAAWHSHSPVVCASPRAHFFSRVMSGIAQEAAAEMSYFGVLAALANSIALSKSGLSITVGGPQDRLADFFLALFALVLAPSTLAGSEEKYETFAEATRRRLASNVTSKPYELVDQCFANAANVVYYTFEEVLRASAGATYADYTAFVQEYLAAGLYYEFFVSGNVPNAEHVQSTLIEPFEQCLKRMGVQPARREDIPRIRDVYAFASPRDADGPLAAMPCIDVLAFPPFDPSNVNLAVLFNIYLGPETAVLRALSSCLCSLLSSRFFNALRTREALGYVVHLRAVRCGGAAHLQFVVQSAVRGVGALYLLSRVVAFLAAVEAQLHSMAFPMAAEVSIAAQSLAAQRRKIPDSVDADCADLAARHQHPLGAAHREAEAEALERVDAAALREFFLSRVANSAAARQALAVVVHSAASEEEEESDGILKGADGEWRVVQLPPMRETQRATDDGGCGEAVEEKEGNDEDALKLPDFVEKPMCVALRTYASPSMYNGKFPILRSESI